LQLTNDPFTGVPTLLLNKTVELDFGKPFEEKPRMNFLFTLQQCGDSICADIRGMFSAIVRIDILDPELVTFRAWAAATFTMPFNNQGKAKTGTVQATFPGDVRFTVGLAIDSQLAVGGFPFLKLNSLAGEAQFQMAPFRVIAVALSGSLTILNTTINASLYYSPFQLGPPPQAPSYAFRVTIDQFNLEDALRQLGVDANLGPLNLQLYNVVVSFAKAPVPASPAINPGIPLGLRVSGSLVFLGFNTTVSLRIGPDPSPGASFDISITTVSAAQAGGSPAPAGRCALAWSIVMEAMC
jgi:hypothetical protein